MSAGSRPVSPCARLQIVFGDAVRDDEFARQPGPPQLLLREFGRAQNVFQIGWRIGIEIDAAPVQHQRQRTDQIRTQPHRTHETIFHAQ